MTTTSLARPGRRGFILAATLTLTVACGQATETARSPGTSGRALISDQVHDAGTTGFFWLPPLVPETTYGTFAAGLAPLVSVELLPLGSAPPVATFGATATSFGERVKSDSASHYAVEWHTGRYALQLGATYRIRVLLDGTELGFVDALAMATGAERRFVARDAFFPLVVGRTLPIKFRIDEVGSLCVAECAGRCGTLPDGCECTTACPSGQVCGGGGANVCGADCESNCAGLCGTLGDGCDCGGCPGDQVCGAETANVCGVDCASACAGRCGALANGCQCASCPAGQTCGAVAPNVCCDPEPCGERCGSVSDGCGGMLSCGACSGCETEADCPAPGGRCCDAPQICHIEWTCVSGRCEDHCLAD